MIAPGVFFAQGGEQGAGFAGVTHEFVADDRGPIQGVVGKHVGRVLACQRFEAGCGLLRVLAVEGAPGHFLQRLGGSEQGGGAVVPGGILVIEFLKVIRQLEP